MVPVSCPPWPASTTIFPILSPSARTSDRSPADVGRASRAAIFLFLTLSLSLLVAMFRRLDFVTLTVAAASAGRGETDWKVGALVGLEVALNSFSFWSNFDVDAAASPSAASSSTSSPSLFLLLASVGSLGAAAAEADV